MNDDHDDEIPILRGPSLSSDGRIERPEPNAPARFDHLELDRNGKPPAKVDGPAEPPLAEEPLELDRRPPTASQLDARAATLDALFAKLIGSKRPQQRIPLSLLLSVGFLVIVGGVYGYRQWLARRPVFIEGGTDQGSFTVVGDTEPVTAPGPMFLIVDSVPTGADVTIDGVRVGQTPWVQDAANAAVPTIELKLAGYAGWKGKPTRDGQKLRVNQKLKPLSQ